ncbi:MAG: response regulator, partial [Chlorobi bacterium]|nr:response regulator [Chlorobiota bacterium]
WMEIEKSSTGSIHCYFLPAYLNTVPSRAKPLVLVIEDNPHIGKLLELYLSRAGYQTRYAPDSSKAMDIALEIKPDLITLDVYMPNKDGWQILSAFRKNEETVKIPVIVITVMKDAQIGYELGASDYLTKPVEKDNLIHSALRLAPVLSSPESREPLERILVVGEQNELLDTLQTKLADATLKVLAPDVQTLYEEIGDFKPQLVCFAFSELESSMKYLLYRLRLVPHVSDIPAVLVTKEPLESALHQSLAAVMDDIFQIDGFDPSHLASY